MFSGVERSRSVSSIRSTSSPPAWRASSQLNSAVRAPPMCSAPVGDGAKRTLMSGAGYCAAARRTGTPRPRVQEAQSLRAPNFQKRTISTGVPKIHWLEENVR